MQGFLAFSASATVTNELAPAVSTYLTNVVDLAVGAPSEIQIVGQSPHAADGG